ncbi:MAG TPA: cobyrinate a,c-diamide synthase [Stellaceae bacterium]|nr:cobyrinate a,c-diamide synthase [Stellaceae bacterium]
MSGGIILAAPASGSGKTLITAGLLRHLHRRGIKVAAAKVGPDYIDPTFHALASRAPCINLDSWAMRPATLAALVQDLEGSTELVLCEGVMGLFDGSGPDGTAGSTAELARIAGWPVVLIVDASGQGASVAALVAGFAQYDRGVPLAGVILNRVASPRHQELLVQAIRRHLPGLPVLGALRRDRNLALPARHLGLVPAAEIAGVEALVENAAVRIAEELDIAGLVSLARPSRCDRPRSDWGLPPLGQRIAVARDDAFLFTYEATLAAWRRQGAELSFFSPLCDEPPRPDADSIYLPGGYPELHAARLAAAPNFMFGLRRAAGAGVSVYGECGGYMVLGEALTGADGVARRMAGLLPLETSFKQRRLHLGYRTARLLAPSPLGLEDARFRGHEFHYATIVAEGDADALFAITDASGTDLGRSGLRSGSVFGSFIHLIDRKD